MKRMLSLLVLVLAWGKADSLLAQETAENELNLVRQLRAKGWYDLTRTRIEELLKRGDPALAAALPIELARVNIAEARQKDPEQRFALFTAARAQLQDFIAKNKGKADAALASAELARLTSYHAQAILSKAMREEEPRTRHERARPAEAMFIEAGKDLEEAIKAIDSALKETGNAELKTMLERELKQVRFDVAINIFDQARTYIDKSKEDTNEKRAVAMVKAKDAFFKLRSDESSQVGWLANAWLMKCGMETTTPGDINKYYDFIMTRKDEKNFQPAIQPAVRLVRYFALQDLTLPRDDAETIGNNSITGKNPKAKMTPIQRLHKVQSDAEAWLKAYPAHFKTYEGQGVLFELAYAYFSEALYEKDQKQAAPHYEKAVLYFDQLAKLDGDLAERARQMSMSIQFKTLNVKGELKTFDQYMMKAMIERKSVIATSIKLDEFAAKAAKANGDKTKLDELNAQKKKLDEERKRHLRDVIASLNKALALETSKTPVKRVDEARYFLSGAYLAAGDPYRAAIVAEALGRMRTPRSSDGAATAIATYSSLQNREPDNDVIRLRLRGMAEFVLSQPAWSAEPVASLAHYHVAMSYQRENKPKEAIAHLEKIAKDFTDYIYIQGQLVFIAEAAREKAADKKEQKWYLDIAKQALARMPKVNPRSDSSTVIAMYFYAKIQLSKYMYAEAIEELNANQGLKAVQNCNDMKKYVVGLRGEFDQLPGNTISPKNREQLEFEMQIMMKYADLGIAETNFRSDRNDRFDDVLKATKKVVDDALAVAATTPKDEYIKLKDYRVTGDILGLALRAHVQKGGDGIEKGKAILDVLKRLTSLDEGGKPGNVVAVLLKDIAGQIKRMKEAGDTKALAATKTNYTSFLDEIAKEYDKKGYDNNSTLMLAHAYSSLEIPGKAAAIFSKVPAPANLDKKVVKPKVETEAEMQARQAWEEEVGRYWGVQIEYIRALRGCKDKESTQKAEKAVETLLKHPNARFKIQALMEKNFILEDTQRYRAAFLEWQAFMKRPEITGFNLQNKDVQKIFFTGYFYTTRTCFKLGALDPEIKDKQKFIDGAAKMIIKLEYSKDKTGWEIAGWMFQDLLKDKENEQLKKAYDTLKAQQPKAASSLSVPRHEGGVRSPWSLVRTREFTCHGLRTTDYGLLRV